MIKKSQNQYINETELKSLIIRINNKSFRKHLSSYFNELNIALMNFQNKKSEKTQIEIIDILNKIIKTKKYQLLLLDEKKIKILKRFVKGIDSQNISFKDILEILIPLNTEILEKNKILNHNRNNDLKRLNKYINIHTKSKSQKYKRILRDYIIKISERTIIDYESYERFGELVLLIIKNILKKPKFSGYSYRDEFYSDSTDKIFRYIKNFNHKLISKITNQPVNAFSYISQYIHNSIIHIINEKNEENEAIQNFINSYNSLLNDETNNSKINFSKQNIFTKNIQIKTTLIEEINKELNKINTEKYTDFEFIYPSEYKVSIDEYNKILKIKELLCNGYNCTFTIKRKIKDEQ